MESTNLLSQDVEQQQQARSVRFDSEQKDYKYYLVWFWRFCIFGLVGSSSMKMMYGITMLHSFLQNYLSIQL
ncbi:hypothetical protein BDF21DRAFT_458552 [Thamnidium elegans]|nr:hypothetical protein BDF21DRAFT_458552 [Thamnidium elegans]